MSATRRLSEWPHARLVERTNGRLLLICVSYPKLPPGFDDSDPARGKEPELRAKARRRHHARATA